MKIARFSLHDGHERVGLVVRHAGADRLLDVQSASSLHGKPVQATMLELIQSGPRALDQLHALLSWFNDHQEPACLHSFNEVNWLTPVPPRSFIAAGRNFGKHRLESVQGNKVPGSRLHNDFPTGFVKLGRCLVPHGATVKRPHDVTAMDYEVEVAVVVGRSLDRASPAQARDAIFGYTVFNDISAREWQLAEMKNQLVMLGKNFPGFGPIGPWILTADEVPDPTALELKLEVNGELRQHDTCNDLLFSFEELVAFWSRVGLEPGDLIASGTPEGVALHRKPDPSPFYLKPGDIVRASVTQIGVLETHIA